MDKEQKNYLKMIVVLLVFFVLFVASLQIASCSTQTANAAVPETELKGNHDARIIKAYSNLLHRIWLDKPSYVEDVLWEYDEMLELDELLQGDWDKTFEFWSAQDSIEYHLNWMHVDELTKM